MNEENKDVNKDTGEDVPAFEIEPPTSETYTPNIEATHEPSTIENYELTASQQIFLAALSAASNYGRNQDAQSLMAEARTLAKAIMEEFDGNG